jgi:hypothetical protein
MTEKIKVASALIFQGISFIVCGIAFCFGVYLNDIQLFSGSLLLAIFGVYFKLVEAEERLK